ncbi:MAG: DNA cytosine methyltransferase, partial [Clostridia bacterium]
MGRGNLLGQSYWVENSAWLGESSTLNTGASPNVGVESTLSQILEVQPLQKYYLSKTACLGILRRAKHRDKELPPQLETALKIQAEIIEPVMKLEEKDDNSFFCLCDQGGERMDIEDNMVTTLRASMGGNLPIVRQELYENHAKDSRYTGPLNVSPTISATYGTGGNNVPFVTKPIAFGIESSINQTETSHTIDTANPNPNKSQGGLAIIQKSYCIAANTINRDVKNGGNGLGVQDDISYTLTTADIPAVATFEPYQQVVGALMHRDHKGVNTCYVNQDKCIVAPYQEVIGTLCAGDEKGTNNQYVNQDKCIVEPKIFGQSSYGGYNNDIATLTSSGGYLGGGSENLAINRNLVRRLTPLECERLQGFPDNWTNIPKASDSPRYKALGNSVAIPCVSFVMRGISYFLNQQNKEREKCNTATLKT